jgi:glycosyltransferase involved in cell wall biosynthesis
VVEIDGELVDESSGRPRVLILVYSELARDARVLRQIRWLRERFDVTSAAFGPSPIDGVEHVELRDLPPYIGGRLERLRYAVSFVLGRFRGLTVRNPRDQSAAAILGEREWDIIIANDVTALPLASTLRARRGVLADLHEYSPRQAEESLMFRLTSARYFRWVLRAYLPRVSRVTTVSQGIADEYARRFGVRPVVVANAAAYQRKAPTPVGSPIRIVHSAVPSPARHIEVMIAAVRDTTANVTLDLYLVDDGGAYLQSLKALANTTPKVTIHGPVPNSELIDVLGQHDLGVHLLPAINFNHRWALPNKFFDYVQARLGIIIGPSPEMSRLVHQHGLGVVSKDFTAQSLTELLNTLRPEQVAQWKAGSDAAARELSGEHQLETFERVLNEMLTARSAP